VSELRVQIQDTLDYRRNADIWELFELKRDMVESGRKILLRGFGIADRNAQHTSRIVIILEEIGFRHAPVEVCDSEIPHSTAKEPVL